jgi:hypothetical protein
MKEVESPFFGNLVAAAQENPLAAAFIGLGAFWLISGGAVFSQISPVARTASDAAARARSRSAELGRAAVDRATAGAEKLTSTMSDAIGTIPPLAPVRPIVAEAQAQATSTLTDLLERQPLVLAPLGIIAGGLLAAALPRTEREAELMGDASAQTKADLRKRTEAVAPIVESGARAVSQEATAAASQLTAEAQKAGRKALKAGRDGLMKGSPERRDEPGGPR